jgi:small-conductance mechanosensitive channel
MGFAAKDMLSNIFGGLMLQMDRPFSTGDWIRSSLLVVLVKATMLQSREEVLK